MGAAKREVVASAQHVPSDCEYYLGKRLKRSQYVVLPLVCPQWRLSQATHGCHEWCIGERVCGGLSGCQQISTRLAEKLGLGTGVRLNSQVSDIDQSEQRRLLCVCVKCRDGKKYMAQRVIVALAPMLYNRISWKPGLPTDKLAVVYTLSTGHVIKTLVVYETAGSVIWVALVRFGTPMDQCSIQWTIANQQNGKTDCPRTQL
jgi:monoamine oxidase